MAAAHKNVEVAKKALAGLDMEQEDTFVIPRHLTTDRRVLESNKPQMGIAQTGVPTARPRSFFAKTLVNAAYPKLPITGFASQERVGEAMKARVFASGGTECTLGRIQKAYPARGVRPRLPVSALEAEAAMGRCGLVMEHLPAPALVPYPIVALPGQVSVTVNPNSDNGFPVLGKWGDPKAAQMCYELAMTVRQEIDKMGGDAWRWLRTAEKSKPYLVAVRGKAKGDYYSQDKVVGARMRFYNAFPRQVMLNMQTATQVMEQNARSVVSGVDVHSGMGVSLTHGGAGAMVEALEEQLKAHGWAYVHVGDDSWVIVRVGDKLIMFALDCSNFDLTQHGLVTEEVHKAFRRQLRCIDPVAADLWYAYARERLVVVVDAVVRRWKHAGPSGMPLQSKVNDVLMDVLINRLRGAVRTWTEPIVAEAVERVAADMGFSVKLEQYTELAAESIVDFLQREPFLFVGYYFHVRGGEVRVCADIPRTFAQVPYPSAGWTREKKDLQIIEAMRLGSISLNLGLPPADVEAAVQTFRDGAKNLVRDTLARFGDQVDERLRWAVQESPFGATTVPSLAGLLRALDRDPKLLWQPEAPLPATSQFVALTWADSVAEEEEREEAQYGVSYRRPRADLSVRAVQLPKVPAHTHPSTSRNDGRPAPTAVWGPPREARQPVALPGRRTRRRDGLAMREFHDALEDEWQEESSDDFL